MVKRRNVVNGEQCNGGRSGASSNRGGGATTAAVLSSAVSFNGSNGTHMLTALEPSTRTGNGNLTNHQRKIICEFYQKNGAVMSQKDLAQWTKHEFGLKKTPAQSTISGILRRQHEFINMSSLELGVKKRRVVQHPELDDALANWVIQCAHRGVTVQGDATKEKAKHFAKMLNIPDEEQPEFSNGWLHCFQQRHNFSFRKFNADSQVENRRVLYFTTMEDLICETQKYQLDDMYCMEEAGVSYCLPPLQAISDPILIKKRFVVVLATNASGTDKLQPLFISHHKNPKCFKGRPSQYYGLSYLANSKAWMTGVIFSRWIQQLDLKMRAQKRHILLFLSEAPSHVVCHLDLTNIVVFFLPSASSINLNPMTSGIVMAFKRRFRRLHLRNAVEREEDGKKILFSVDLLHAMQWAVASWNEVTPDVIHRSWTMTNTIPGRVSQLNGQLMMENSEEGFLEAELLQQMQLLRLVDPVPVSTYLNDELRFEDRVHDEFFEIIHIGEEVPDDDVNEQEEEFLPCTLTSQEQLKAIRDVMQILKERNDNDETTVSTLKRVYDLIRSETRNTPRMSVVSANAATIAAATAVVLSGADVTPASSVHAPMTDPTSVGVLSASSTADSPSSAFQTLL